MYILYCVWEVRNVCLFRVDPLALGRLLIKFSCCYPRLLCRLQWLPTHLLFSSFGLDRTWTLGRSTLTLLFLLQGWQVGVYWSWWWWLSFGFGDFVLDWGFLSSDCGGFGLALGSCVLRMIVFSLWRSGCDLLGEHPTLTLLLVIVVVLFLVLMLLFFLLW